MRHPIEVPIVIAAIAYYYEYTGDTHILILHRALYFKNMTENLIPPIMMRMTGLEVDECSNFLAKESSDRNHSVYFPSMDLRISLHLKVIISFIPTPCPSKRELK